MAGIKEIFASRLKALRTMKGMTQEELALKIGLSRQSVAMFESKNTWPRDETVDLLAKVLEVEPYELFYEGTPLTVQDAIDVLNKKFGRKTGE